MGLTYSRAVRVEPAVVSAWHPQPGAITRPMPSWQLVRVALEVPPARGGQTVFASASGPVAPSQPGPEGHAEVGASPPRESGHG